MTAEQATLGEFALDLSALTPAERDAYNAVRRGEYGPREFARQTDRSPGTVSNLLARAEQKLDEAT
jgi:DNA-binding CsgD family transcriptional regulator